MKKTITAIAAMMLVFTAGAQEKQQDTTRNTSHYITVDFGGGYQNLVYSLGSKGKREPGMGIMGRLGYRYFFTEHWGAGINVVYKQSLTRAKINYETDAEERTDSEGEKYDFHVSYNNLKEKQKQTSIAIPLGIYFQGNITPKWKAGFGTGISMQFVNDDTFEIDGGDVSAYGYYHKDNIKFSNMPNHDLPAPRSDFECSYDYKASFGVFAELNFMYALARWVDLNIGIYGGYGLSKSTKESDHQIYEYSNEANNHYYGALNSNATKGSHPLSIGMMAGFRFKIGKNKVENKPADEEIKQVEVVNNNPQKEEKNEPQPDANPTDNQVVENKNDELEPADNNTVKPEEAKVVNITDIVTTNPSNNPEQTKPVEPKKEQNVVYTEKGKQVVINGRTYTVVDTIRMIINFELGSAGDPDITVVDQTIDDVASYLKQHPDCKLSIVGHTCDLGSDATNNRIGLERAKTVKNMFINRGIASSRLLTSTKADKQPLVPNTSDQNRSRNRRVELEYVK
ncbi:MAG: OmpA family protein [Bacteroidales bacterium]|nr:OmpA family protein [Bacteroidales bacterium]